jgi:outer membrane protein TolC
MRLWLLVGVLVTLSIPSAHAQKKRSSKGTERAAAEPAETISLAQTLQVAVRQSYTLAAATIDVAIAEAAILQASGIEDFVLAASGALSIKHDEQAVEGETMLLEGTDDENIYQFNAGISKLFWTGARVSLNASGVRTDSTRPVFQDVDMPPNRIPDFVFQVDTDFYTGVVEAQITQPLLQGFGETATREAEIRARYARDAAQLERDAVVRNLIRDLVSAYWEVAFSIRDLEIRRASLALAAESRRLTQSRVKLGNAAPTELNAVDQVMATREEEVLLGELAVSERSLDLRRLAGLEIGPGQIDLKTAEILTVKPVDIDLDDILARAFASSPELAALEAQGKGARIEVEVTENGLLPRLDLTVSGGPRGTSETASDALSRLSEFKTYQIGASLELEYAFGNNTAQGANLRARENLRRVSVQAADVRRQIAVAVVQAVKLVRSANRRMELSQIAIDLSEKNIEAEQRRFELGRSTNFDVLLRQDELRQSQQRFARASVDYLEALALIDALTGDILPKYGIKVEAAERAD